jgi:hypothetical protein
MLTDISKKRKGLFQHNLDNILAGEGRKFRIDLLVNILVSENY